MDNMTLGEFVDALEACGLETRVFFDRFGLVPTSFNSYRGYYDHLALGFELEGIVMADELAERAKQAIGKTFGGWKGGEYTMSRHTPLWASNTGRVTRTKIVGTSNDGWSLIILTASDED